MALNMLYKYSENKTRELTVPSGVLSGQPVQVGNIVGFALTTRGDAATGGIGNRDTGATVATDGTFIYAVTGVVGGTTQGTPVYITSGRTLTRTASGNTIFGVVDGVNNTAASTAVKVGA